MEMIPKVLGAVAEVGKAAMTAQSQRPPVDPRVAAAGMGQQQVAIQTPEGIKLIPASMLSQMQAQQMPPRREKELVRPIPVPQPQQAQRRRPAPAPQPEIIDMPESTEAEGDVKPIPVEEVIEKALEKSEHFRAAEEVNTIKRAKDAKMPLPKQKVARKAIRELGDKLSKAEESEWSGMVTEAIMAEFAIYTYIKAVTVYAALAEAKLEPSLAERIVKALRESGMIPEDVPFTETDFQRLSAPTQTEEGEV
jgi:ribosomal protein S25